MHLQFRFVSRLALKSKPPYNTISSYLQALKPKVKIAGGKELIYREGDTATIFAEVPSEPPAEDIRD